MSIVRLAHARTHARTCRTLEAPASDALTAGSVNTQLRLKGLCFRCSERVCWHDQSILGRTYARTTPIYCARHRHHRVRCHTYMRIMFRSPAIWTECVSRTCLNANATLTRPPSVRRRLQNDHISISRKFVLGSTPGFDDASRLASVPAI